MKDLRDKRKLPHIEVTTTTLKWYACIMLLFYAISMTVIQRGMLGMDGLSGVQLQEALAQQSETPFSEEIACDIYADFDIALRQGSKNSDTDMIKAKAIILISKSDVLIPEKYEELNRLVQWNG